MNGDSTNGPNRPTVPAATPAVPRWAWIAQTIAVLVLVAIAAFRGGSLPQPPVVSTALPDGRVIDLSSDELRGVGVLGVGVVVPRPVPPTTPERQTREEVIRAIGRVQFGGGACSAQAVHPRRTDGRWDVLCAAHCVAAPGQRGRMRVKDGREFGVVVVAVDKSSDCTWLRTETPVESLPAVVLHDRDAVAGDKVWQSGYGWHEPGVAKTGECNGRPTADGKQPFTLSLSQGDSGGGFYTVDDNRLVSVACCTTEIAAKALAFGPSLSSIKALRLKAVAWDDWEPAPVPQCDQRGQVIGDGWRVVGIPQRMPGDSR